MGIRKLAERMLGIYNYDRRGERMIKKSLNLYHRGGKIHRIRAMRMHIKIRKNYGCDVRPQAVVGEGLYIAHPQGIIVGKTAIIGKNCRIYPNAMVIASVVGDDALRLRGESRWHPKIGDNCLLGAGCIVMGKIEIGDDVTIAAGAIVTKDVPSHTVVRNTNEIYPRVSF